MSQTVEAANSSRGSEAREEMEKGGFNDDSGFFLDRRDTRANGVHGPTLTIFLSKSRDWNI
jgi:hypothetical protein